MAFLASIYRDEGKGKKRGIQMSKVRKEGGLVVMVVIVLARSLLVVSVPWVILHPSNKNEVEKINDKKGNSAVKGPEKKRIMLPLWLCECFQDHL